MDVISSVVKKKEKKGFFASVKSYFGKGKSDKKSEDPVKVIEKEKPKDKEVEYCLEDKQVTEAPPVEYMYYADMDEVHDKDTEKPQSLEPEPNDPMSQAIQENLVASVDQLPNAVNKADPKTPSSNTPTEKAKSIVTYPDKLTPEIKNKFKKIIIHLHGGGFIAMSSSYHQGEVTRLPSEDVQEPRLPDLLD
jgi:hypothetical protein